MSIRVEDISYIYGKGSPFEKTALSHVDLTINKGEFIGVIGHRGSGKSTLIQIMAGLLTPTAGTVMLDGQDIHARRYDRSILRRKVGIVFQYPECQLFETTVEKDVAFGLKHSGLSAAEKQARVRWALETVGFSFEKVHDQPPMGLSGGEKRRVAIAGVLATKPEYLILDEPIAGLDPLGREAFLQLITELNRGGMTILMVSEMIDQIYQIGKDIGERISNVVVMGTGEPLDNYDNLLRFIELLTDENGINISQRNLTVSTCGLVPRMRQLADEKLSITLALSLHASNQEKRKALMPVANSYDIHDVVDACKYYFAQTGAGQGTGHFLRHILRFL